MMTFKGAHKLGRVGKVKITLVGKTSKQPLRSAVHTSAGATGSKGSKSDQRVSEKWPSGIRGRNSAQGSGKDEWGTGRQL